MTFADVNHRRFAILLCIFEAALIAVTWPLWLGGDVPFVSFVRLPVSVPVAVDAVLSAFLILGCLSFAYCLVSSKRQSEIGVTAPLSLLTLGATLAFLNMARLQPWHWLFLLLMSESCLRSGHALRRIQRLTIASVYVFAAVSRFDPTFPPDTGVSSSILKTLLDFVDLGAAFKNPQTASVLNAAANAFELLTGTCLLFRRSRSLGVVLAMTLHFSLLLALGPWGLHHSTGVLLWNVLLMIAVPILFGVPWIRVSGDRVEGEEFDWVSVIVIIIPASALFGFADNWIGWQVYSARTDRLWLTIAEDRIDVLPAGLKEHVGAPTPLSDQCVVRMDSWVTAESHAPWYPEDRYQSVLAEWLVRNLDGEEFELGSSTAESLLWWKSRMEVTTDHTSLTERIHAFWMTPSVRE